MTLPRIKSGEMEVHILDFNAINVNAEQAHKLEHVEAEAWKTIYAGVTIPAAQEPGIQCESINSATALMFEKLPVWIFNRVINLGMQQPVTPAELQYLVDLYRIKNLPLGISLSPFALPASLIEQGCTQFVTVTGVIPRENNPSLKNMDSPWLQPGLCATKLCINTLCITLEKTNVEIFYTFLHWNLSGL